MPDLTIETQWMCASLEREVHLNIGDYHQVLYHGINADDECTCLGYKYSKTRICKHLKQAYEEECSWHGAYDEPAKEDGVCPRCGGEAVAVRVAV